MDQPLRQRCSDVLRAKARNEPLTVAVHVMLSLLIIVNVASVVMDTVEPFARDYADWFWGIEIICTTAFTIEYLLRIWSAPTDERFAGRFGRLRYIASPMAIIDLVSILPVFLLLLTSIDLRFVRIMRLLRLLKFTRYSSGMDLIVIVFRQQLGMLGATSAGLACFLIFSSGAIYLLEHQVQPETFGNLPKTLYWAIITLSTVGYGDVVPVTVGGKILAAIIALSGIVMIAVPAGILASAFSSELRRREETYRQTAVQHMQGGLHLTDAMRARLQDHQDELGLTDEQAELIINDVREVHRGHIVDDTLFCPHCRKALRIEVSDRTRPR
ncbi:potassium transporter Kef [Thalassospira marina]|uniref:Potassium transporter Kef n=2 Tax=Thalassospira marina TaxID=2048283 RepID=A0A2N3KT11_9PROT|nr:potassium transporter Kef [Thalassospira marina]